MRVSLHRHAVLETIESSGPITRKELAALLHQKYSELFPTFDRAYANVHNGLVYGLLDDPDGPRGRFVEISASGIRCLRKMRQVSEQF